MANETRTTQLPDQRTTEGPNPTIGAVLVVGAGIGGMQASLDLAEAGFKVYLLDRAPAIGGRMAQLDKTFPTNDCAMCIMSPKLVETGRHLNIEIITTADLEKVEGEPGNFVATIRQHPRYVDVSKCTGCGDCAAKCPIPLPDEFNAGMGTRRAIYKLYPQAIPNAFAIDKRGTAPCRDACPAHQRAQGYIALIREKRFADAYRVIKEDNPFPSICGRVCIAKCETACNRGTLDAPVAIRDLKRFVADWAYENKIPNPKFQLPTSNHPTIQPPEDRVAIIGSGPAGLTCAADLARQGYRVTVFEALPVAGGMMRVGVPNFRLPHDRVQKEIDDILALGVELKLNTRIDEVEKLFADGYSAVFFAAGSHKGRKLPIPNADHPDVIVSLDFLRDVSIGLELTKDEQRTTNDSTLSSSVLRPSSAIENIKSKIQNKRILVLGGGAVAVDAATTARRLGAASVAMACLESRETMPATQEDLKQVEQEGIGIFPARSFKQIVVTDGKIAGVECVNVKFSQFDKDGRLTLETEPDTEHLIECDTVIFAIGQGPDLTPIQNVQGVEQSKRRTVAVDPETLATGRPGLFAGGDAVTGVGFIVDAIAAGHTAARSIQNYLTRAGGRKTEGNDSSFVIRPSSSVVKLSRDEITAQVARGKASARGRTHMEWMAAEERVTNFDEFTRAWTEDEAVAEAERCLACGVCAECLECVYACRAGAVNHAMGEEVRELNVGAVILTPGVEPIDLRALNYRPEFGYGRYPNVVTSLEFERLLSATGPTQGVVARPSDGSHPKKVAWIQCVGSRDCAREQGYCSSICCMYATKEAVIAREHDANIEPTIFYLDLRAYGKDFDRYIERAKSQGVRYVRSMVSAVEPGENGNLRVRYALDEGPQVEEFDMVVLAVGVKPNAAAQALAQRLGISLNEYGFSNTLAFNPTATTRPGIFVAGPFGEPKDIPETVIEASAAAACASRLLTSARGTLARIKTYPPERDVSDEEPRVGVFVCHCGINIGGVVRVPEVVEYARTLPGVVYAEHNLYTCSQDTQARIKARIDAHRLNRVVVASCTPRTHESLFQDTLREAGLNPHLFELANIREQDSWVHRGDRDAATNKAKDLVAMMVARVQRNKPLYRLVFDINPRALVIGGGLAGMTAAQMIADQGHEVYLIERDAELGGHARHIYYAVAGDQSPVARIAWHDTQPMLQDTLARVRAHPRIHLYTRAEVAELSGYVGRFKSRIHVEGEPTDLDIEHGAIIVATGAKAMTPGEYLYGSDPRVITQQEFESWLAGDPKPEIENLKSVLMIQCVGSRDDQRPYCSRICCQQAIKNALKLKELNPNTQIVVLNRDLRVYGFKEDTYREARARGVLFLRYEPNDKPRVSVDDAKLRVTVSAAFAPGGSLTFEPDLLVLSVGIEPEKNEPLAQLLKVPLTQDGFFLEAHAKLRPLDFAADGIFLCGLAHSPRTLEESIAQAQGAAIRAVALLSQRQREAVPIVASVNERLCAGCGLCVEACPYGARSIDDDARVARVNAALCQGCGACVVACPNGAAQQKAFEMPQVFSMIEYALA
jgi:heterodisulfide reductase subunit A-like polyferredoxin